MWKIVNRERKERKRINEGIEMGEWKEHFMKLLGEVEERVVKGDGGLERGEGNEEDKRGNKEG